MERNPDYAWGRAFPGRTNAGPTYLDKLTLKFIPELGTRDALMDARKEINVEAWPGPQSVAHFRRF